MNVFEKKIAEHDCPGGLFGETVDTLQVNLGLRCNQQCLHCHQESSPERTEMMEWPVMELILDAVDRSSCRLVDVTGGAPELNPLFRRFVLALRKRPCKVQVRTNLTVLLDPAMEGLPEFLRDQSVQIVASLPCYTEENVRAQRGGGVFEQSIEAIRRLNALGYGLDPSLSLDLVYNPGGPFLPSDQSSLEDDYRQELAGRFGVAFSRLLTLTNMPLGRFRKELTKSGQIGAYRQLLKESFNAASVSLLMCRSQISIGWDGTLYDCDFNLALGLPVNHGAPDHITSFSTGSLRNRRIVTGEHCFGCTAGAGSSCSGSLVLEEDGCRRV